MYKNLAWKNGYEVKLGVLGNRRAVIPKEIADNQEEYDGKIFKALLPDGKWMRVKLVGDDYGLKTTGTGDMIVRPLSYIKHKIPNFASWLNFYQIWYCSKCKTYTLEFDFDCDAHKFSVYNIRGRYLGTIYCGNVQDTKDTVNALNEKRCPICEGWDSGDGDICTKKGW